MRDGMQLINGKKCAAQMASSLGSQIFIQTLERNRKHKRPKNAAEAERCTTEFFIGEDCAPIPCLSVRDLIRQPAVDTGSAGVSPSPLGAESPATPAGRQRSQWKNSVMHPKPKIALQNTSTPCQARSRVETCLGLRLSLSI